MLGLSAAACSQLAPSAMPAKLEKYCVTESGMSQFYMSLDVTAQTGKIRYKYLGQDVLYDVRSVRADGDKIFGQADFLRAASGETRGTPLIFSYTPSDDTLVDGAATANCSNLQDSSMLELR